MVGILCCVAGSRLCPSATLLPHWQDLCGVSPDFPWVRVVGLPHFIPGHFQRDLPTLLCTDNRLANYPAMLLLQAYPCAVNACETMRKLS
jgi:hypothetical protein